MYSKNISQSECEEFHQLSNGNPRVQSYAIANGASSVQQILQTLRPEGKTLMNVFGGILNAFITRAGLEREQAEEVLSILVQLPRPVPSTVVQEITGWAKDIRICLVSRQLKISSRIVGEKKKGYIKSWIIIPISKLCMIFWTSTPGSYK